MGCRALDNDWALPLGQPRPSPGPAETSLLTYGEITKVGFGHWGEFSTDLHNLVDTLAAAGAEKNWRSMLSASPDYARAHLVHHYRSRLFFAHQMISAELLQRRCRSLIRPGPTGAGPQSHEEGGHDCAVSFREAMNGDDAT